MAANEYLSKATARIRHVEEHLNGNSFKPADIELLVGRIEAGIDWSDESQWTHWPFLTFESYFDAKASHSWFSQHDLQAFKNWCYNRGKVFYTRYQRPYWNRALPSKAGTAFMGAHILLSDHDGLIGWYSNVDFGFDEKELTNVRMGNYWTKQLFLSLRGDWDILEQRCTHILANPPRSGHGKLFLPDHEFYLALARQDVSGMIEAIYKLVTPKLIKSRAGIETGYTENLISTLAVLYTKLAWRHGHEIEIDSSYIPMEWMPIKPLAKYDDEFAFTEAMELD